MDKVVQITRSFVGNKIKGVQASGGKKATVELFVGTSAASTTVPNPQPQEWPEGYQGDPNWVKNYVVSESLSIRPSSNPEEYIWNVIAGENPEGIIYLVVADNITQYMFRVYCPTCDEKYLYFFGTF